MLPPFPVSAPGNGRFLVRLRGHSPHMARHKRPGLAAAIGAALDSVQAGLHHAAPRQIPRFSSEGPTHYAAAFRQNRPFAKPGPYQTPLRSHLEAAFRQWAATNYVPFDVHAPKVDYDMRGFFKATGGRGWRPGQHFPDTFKTPYDTSFSRESRYASRSNPFVWRRGKLVDRRTGHVVFGP